MPTELMSAAITVLSNASSKLSNLLDELFSGHLLKVAVHLLLLMPNYVYLDPDKPPASPAGPHITTASS